MRMFPVLPDRSYQASLRGRFEYPASVDWALVEAHSDQAERNHRQTLERLAARGGLSIGELICVLTDRGWWCCHDMSLDEQVATLRSLIEVVS